GRPARGRAPPVACTVAVRMPILAAAWGERRPRCWPVTSSTLADGSFGRLDDLPHPAAAMARTATSAVTRRRLAAIGHTSLRLGRGAGRRRAAERPVEAHGCLPPVVDVEGGHYEEREQRG